VPPLSAPMSSLLAIVLWLCITGGGPRGAVSPPVALNNRPGTLGTLGSLGGPLRVMGLLLCIQGGILLCIQGGPPP